MRACGGRLVGWLVRCVGGSVRVVGGWVRVFGACVCVRAYVRVSVRHLVGW